MSLMPRPVQWNKHCFVYCGADRCDCSASASPDERLRHYDMPMTEETQPMEQKSTEKVNEILNILQEECAEVIQMVSKCRRFGIDNIHIKSEMPNRDKLTEEIGDMLAMVELLIENNVINAEELAGARVAKIEKLKKWSTIFKDGK